MGIEAEGMDVSQLNVYSIVVCSIWRLITYLVAFSSMSVQQIFSFLFIFATSFELFGVFPSAFILLFLFSCFVDRPLLISSPILCRLILSCPTVPSSLLLPVSPFL